MSTSNRMTWAAALAVLLTASSLRPLYEGVGWLPAVAGVLVVVALAGALGRRVGLPTWWQPPLTALAAAGFVVAVYARATLAYGVLPTGATTEAIRALIGAALLDVEKLAPAVPTRPGLVMLAVLGTAAVALAVDLLAVGLRRPAVAGLPLLVLLAVPAGLLEGGGGWFPFALGAAGWLALLLIDGRDRAAAEGARPQPDVWLPTPLSPDLSRTRVGRRIGLAAVGVAVIVPALVPGLDGRLLGGSGGGPGLGGSRSTTTYNPITELGGQLRLPAPRPLLAYRTTDPQPDYLRMTTLDRFDDNTGWSSSELSGDVRRDNVGRGIPTPVGVGAVPTQAVSTAIRVQGLAGPWLPVPMTPTGVDVAGSWLWDRRSETVFSTRTDVRGLTDVYRVSAARPVPVADVLRQDGPVPPEIEPYSRPPAVSPYVRELTDRTVAGAATRYDEMVALQALFRDPTNGFRYSEEASVPGINAPNALEAFLRGQQGFCEQYASAMAAMARLRGVPARVAVGFIPGTLRPDGTRQVTTSDAHAWPEIWFPTSGWIRFEPTPRGALVSTPGYTVPPVTTPGASAPGSAAPTDTTTQPGTATDPGQTARDPGGSPQDRFASGPVGDGAPPPPSAAARAAPWLGVLAALAVLASPAGLAGWRRRRRWAQPGPLAAWEQVQEDAADVGHRWQPADSPRSAAARLQTTWALPGTAPEALARLAMLAERARYGRPRSQSPPDAAGVEDPAASVEELRRDVATVRAALRATAPEGRRWAARFAPPSTVHWAASGLADVVADGLDRTDELLPALRRKMRRPPRSA